MSVTGSPKITPKSSATDLNANDLRTTAASTQQTMTDAKTSNSYFQSAWGLVGEMGAVFQSMGTSVTSITDKASKGVDSLVGKSQVNDGTNTPPTTTTATTTTATTAQNFVSPLVSHYHGLENIGLTPVKDESNPLNTGRSGTPTMNVSVREYKELLTKVDTLWTNAVYRDDLEQFPTTAKLETETRRIEEEVKSRFVSKQEFETRTASFVSKEELGTSTASFVSKEELATSTASFVSKEELATRTASFVTQDYVSAEIAKVNIARPCTTKHRDSSSEEETASKMTAATKGNRKAGGKASESKRDVQDS